MSITTSFFAIVQNDLLEVEAIIRAQAEGYHPDLGSALDHLLSSGGKRIRPSLTLLAGRMLGAEHHRLLTLASAIELLHTATLVHDDLIDGSLLRRGISTLNAQWSPGATVLTGDFLFARAAELAADTNSVPVMKLFSHTLSEIVNGEITQLFRSRCKLNRQDYYDRIYAKTASLFRTSAYSAALLSPVEQETQDYLRQYGYEVGMAFQIMDDILDFTGKEDVLGKPVGSDLRQGLITLPTIYFIENYPNDPGVVQIQADGCLDNQTQVSRLVSAIRSSDAIDMARAEARRFVQRGLDAIQCLPPSTERHLLEDLARYIVERDL
ncbi:MAG TPA: polyprenyl synthetase family protein [Anaerolineaceae bacterium]|nr:polyprenyl synthetase family protein [Anaerolineaceae bacterium]